MIASIILGDMISGKEITVDDSGGADYQSIQQAIDASEDGDTILVSEGEYHEKITVDKEVSIIGEWKETTKIIGTGIDDAVTIEANYVNMSEFQVTGGGSNYMDSGVLVLGNYVKLTDIRSMYNEIGIHVNRSRESRLTDCIVSENKDGIVLFASDRMKIDNNDIRDNEYGLELKHSDICTISNNSFLHNSRSGIFYHETWGNIFDNNSVIDCDYAIRIWGDDHIVTNNLISDNKEGLFLYRIDECNVYGNTISGNDKGLVSWGLFHSTITDNTVSENRIGWAFEAELGWNEITMNTFEGNTEYAIDDTALYRDPVEAPDNYWGNLSGPYHPTHNPNGTGDNVTDRVDFDPWIGKYGSMEGDDIVLYVDDDADPYGVGTKERPFNSIGDAIDSAPPRSLIRVWEGTYNAVINIDKQVRVIGNGSAYCHINGSSFRDKDTIHITADGCELSGFTILGGQKNWPTIFPSGLYIESDDNKIHNNTFTENYHGIHLKDADGNHLSDNVILQNSWSGIWIEASDSNEIMENKIRSNYLYGIHLEGSNNNLIVGNELRSNSYGVDLSRSYYNILLENTMTNSSSVGVRMATARNNDIRNNTIDGNKGGFFFSFSPENLIENNSIEDNEEYGAKMEYGLADYIDMRNNWWGHVAGPALLTHRPGQGDAIIGSILYDPWIGKDKYENFDILYVDDDALNHDGYGSMEEPFKTIQDAVDHAKIGDAIVVREGNYYGSIYVNLTINLTAEKDDHSVRLIGQGKDDVLNIHANNCEFNGLYIIGDWKETGYEYSGISVEGTGNLISNMVLEDNYLGLMISTPEGNIFQENDVRNNHAGMVVLGGKEAVITNNRLVENEYGFILAWTLTANICWNTFTGNSYGIFLNGSKDAIIHHNDFHENGVGVYSERSEGCLVNANSFVNNTDGGILLELDPFQKASDWNFDARGNWWGTETGPYHRTYNPGGEGDNVTGGILFEPFIVDPSLPVVALDILRDRHDDEDQYQPSLWQLLFGWTEYSGRITLDFIMEGWSLKGDMVRFSLESDIDGILSNGTDSRLELWNLTPGKHTITLIGQDSLGNWSNEVSIQITVEENKKISHGLNPCLGIILLIIPCWMFSIGVHEFGHLITAKYYTMKGENINRAAGPNVDQSPLGYILKSGYQFQKWFSILMLLVFIGILTLADSYSTSGLMFLLVFSGLSVVIGTIMVNGGLGMRVVQKFEDPMKLKIIKKWVNKGCKCGNHSFLLGPRKLMCEECRELMEDFTIPDNIKVYTPNHLDPLYIASRKVNRISYKFTINQPRERVFEHLKAPPSTRARTNLGITEFKKIDETTHELWIKGIPNQYTLVDSQPPFFLAYEISCVGELYNLRYYVNAQGQGISTVLIEQDQELTIPYLKAWLHFRKIGNMIKADLMDGSFDS